MLCKQNLYNYNYKISCKTNLRLNNVKIAKKKQLKNLKYLTLGGF